MNQQPHNINLSAAKALIRFSRFGMGVVFVVGNLMGGAAVAQTDSASSSSTGASSTVGNPNLIYGSRPPSKDDLKNARESKTCEQINDLQFTTVKEFQKACKDTGNSSAESCFKDIEDCSDTGLSNSEFDSLNCPTMTTDRYTQRYDKFNSELEKIIEATEKKSEDCLEKVQTNATELKDMQGEFIKLNKSLTELNVEKDKAIAELEEKEQKALEDAFAATQEMEGKIGDSRVQLRKAQEALTAAYRVQSLKSAQLSIKYSCLAQANQTARAAVTGGSAQKSDGDGVAKKTPVKASGANAITQSRQINEIAKHEYSNCIQQQNLEIKKRIDSAQDGVDAADRALRQLEEQKSRLDSNLSKLGPSIAAGKQKAEKVKSDAEKSIIAEINEHNSKMLLRQQQNEQTRQSCEQQITQLSKKSKAASQKLAKLEDDNPGEMVTENWKTIVEKRGAITQAFSAQNIAIQKECGIDVTKPEFMGK